MEKIDDDLASVCFFLGAYLLSFIIIIGNRMNVHNKGLFYTTSDI